MAQSLLVDTDVLIDYLRGVEPAVSFLERARGPLLVSAISVAELYSGVREGAERKAMESFLWRSSLSSWMGSSPRGADSTVGNTGAAMALAWQMP